MVSLPLQRSTHLERTVLVPLLFPSDIAILYVSSCPPPAHIHRVPLKNIRENIETCLSTSLNTLGRIEKSRESCATLNITSREKYGKPHVESSAERLACARTPTVDRYN